MKNLVLFHTGRGGQYHNPGYKTCEGLIDAFDPEYFGHQCDTDENGFISVDGNGRPICKQEDLQNDYGRFEIDGHYDTYEWLPISKLSEREMQIMIRDLKPWEYKDALIEGGVDADVFAIIEGTNNLDEFAETLANKTTFSDFIAYDEVLRFDSEEQAEEAGYNKLVEINEVFYTIE